MAELVYRYGVMNSAKTANLLMVAYGFETYGRHILVIKPSIDTRWSNIEDVAVKVGNIKSRAIPNSHSCELVSSTEDLFKVIQEANNENLKKFSTPLALILVDEAQFLTLKQVRELADVVEKLNISVYCYGLKNTYKDGVLFEGSAALFFYANQVEEIKTVCKFCSNQAIMNLRVVNGIAVYDGDSIQIGDVDKGSESYAQVCYHHYMYPPAPIVGRYGKRNKIKSVSDTLEKILAYNNKQGIYRRRSELNKLNKSDFEYSKYFAPKDNAELENLCFIVIGNIVIDIQKYLETKNKSKLNSHLLFKVMLDFIYTYFEDNKVRAFELLRSSSVRGIEFYETATELERAKKDKKGSLDRFHTLPDGNSYFYQYSAKAGWRFWESLSAGLSIELSDVEILYVFKK